MALKKDAYKTLGLSKSASSSEIKKAYYQLAKQFHPDTNKGPEAKEKFVEIQQAYEILSDEGKRATYDAHGPGAFDGNGQEQGASSGFPGGFPGGFHGGFPGFGQGQGQGFGASDLFEQFFGGSMGGGSSSRGSPLGSDINLSLSIKFMDAIKGVSKTLAFDAVTSCDPCSGTGLKTGAKPKKCSACGGSGQTVFQRGGFLMSAPCSVCHGEGVTIPQGSKCSSCSGKGKVKTRRSVEVDIPAGVQDGSRIRLSRQGHAPLEGQGPNGDLFVELKVCLYSLI